MATFPVIPNTKAWRISRHFAAEYTERLRAAITMSTLVITIGQDHVDDEEPHEASFPAKTAPFLSRIRSLQVQASLGLEGLLSPFVADVLKIGRFNGLEGLQV